MMRAPSGIWSPGKPIRVTAAVPALVVVQDPVGDGVDAEALEHPEPDLRVALEDHPLRLGQRARLAQDLLRDRELAEVVQARGEPGELDLFVGEAKPPAMRAARSATRCEWLPV